MKSYALYQMQTLLLTLGDLYPHPNHPVSTFYVTFHIFVVGEPWTQRLQIWCEDWS